MSTPITPPARRGRQRDGRGGRDAARRRSGTSGPGRCPGGCGRPPPGSAATRSRPLARPGARTRPGRPGRTGRAGRSPDARAAPELDAHLTVGADPDGLVAVALAGLAVRLAGTSAPPPTAPATRASVSRAASRWWRVRASRLPPRTTCTSPASRSARAAASRSSKHPQPPRLRMPLPPRPVTPRRPLGTLLPDRQGQPALDGADTGFQVLHVRRLAAPGQRPLVMRGLGDRPRPPRRRQRRQLPLTHRPRLTGMLQAIPTARLEIPRRQRTQMLTHQPQHLLIPGVSCLSRVRTATPLGPDTTNDAATLPSSPTPSPPPEATRIPRHGKRAPPAKVTHSMRERPFPTETTPRPTRHDTDPAHSLPLTRTLLNTLQRQQLQTPRWRTPRARSSPTPVT